MQDILVWKSFYNDLSAEEKEFLCYLPIVCGKCDLESAAAVFDVSLQSATSMYNHIINKICASQRGKKIANDISSDRIIDILQTISREKWSDDIKGLFTPQGTERILQLIYFKVYPCEGRPS